MSWLTISNQVFNCGLPADDVRLESVSLVSPLWRMASNTASEDDLASQTTGWQQSTRLLVAVDAVDDEQRAAAEQIDARTVGRIEALLDARDFRAKRPSPISLAVSGLSKVRYYFLALA